MTPYMKTIFQQKKKKWNFDQNQWVGPLKLLELSTFDEAIYMYMNVNGNLSRS